MRNLIFTFLALAALCVGTTLNAQSIGIRGGITLANQNFDISGLSVEPDTRLGFQGGIIAETNLTGDLYLDAGLLFLQGGWEQEMEILGATVTNERIYNHISIPITLLYKGEVSDQVSIFGEAGPYVAYALSGKDKIDDDEEDFDFDDNEYNRLDFGLNVGAGAEISQFRLGLHYMLGLANLNDAENNDDASVKNQILGIYAAWMFGGA